MPTPPSTPPRAASSKTPITLKSVWTWADERIIASGWQLDKMMKDGKPDPNYACAWVFKKGEHSREGKFPPCVVLQVDGGKVFCTPFNFAGEQAWRNYGDARNPEPYKWHDDLNEINTLPTFLMAVVVKASR